jgi:hypothetical protein
MAGGDEGKALDPARDLERAYRFHEGIEPKCLMLPLRREKIILIESPIAVARSMKLGD